MADPIDRIIAGLAPDKVKRAPVARNQIRMGWVNTLEERRLIVQAAEARGMSIAAFCRRAVLSFAFRTLGLDYYEEMRGDGPIRTPITPGVKRAPVEDSEHGKGCGPWRITGLD